LRVDDAAEVLLDELAVLGEGLLPVEHVDALGTDAVFLLCPVERVDQLLVLERCQVRPVPSGGPDRSLNLIKDALPNLFMAIIRPATTNTGLSSASESGASSTAFLISLIVCKTTKSLGYGLILFVFKSSSLFFRLSMISLFLSIKIQLFKRLNTLC
ncbi:MAG: hypothetical protein R6U40_13635, partial [Desulfobacterales bacterium]